MKILIILLITVSTSTVFANCDHYMLTQIATNVKFIRESTYRPTIMDFGEEFRCIKGNLYKRKGGEIYILEKGEKCVVVSSKEVVK